MSILTKIFGDPNEKELKKIQPLVEQINALESEIAKLSDEQLKNKTQELKTRLAKGETLDDILVPAFATVREAAKRVLGQRHYNVQLIGGIILHRGMIAEMKTGEGKTLTATLPIYLNALAGKGVHVVTVNDYLARRDASWMGQVYNFLGLTVGCIQNQTVTYIYDSNVKADESDNAEEILKTFKVDMDRLRQVQDRKEAYKCDITYGTNNEFGFDYLRDNMVQDLAQMSQRELFYAIVDEVDSILIDEARTPLIISAPDDEATDKYTKISNIVKNLKENVDFNIDEKMHSVTYTEEGQEKVARVLGEDPWVAMDADTTFHLEAALRAHAMYKRERDYVVSASAQGSGGQGKDGEVIIVDEFTGRLMYGRRYSEGLHQAIEAKEGVKIQKESKTLATITFQNLFRMYEKLSGMTGTALTEAEEFSKIYNLEVLTVPTNKPCIRKDLTDLIFKNEKGKFEAIIKKIKELNEKGQPVLIGTISIAKNELLSDLLTRYNIPHKILNAKQHEKEAEIIAQAGKVGAVTLATNMAGRGVDIILGGLPFDQIEHDKVTGLGGLHVIGTERHEARRIDNQLRGRSGRQGDPGVSQFYVSLEDDLMRVFGSDRVKSLMETFKIPDDMPIENRFISSSLEKAQQRVEGYNFDIRKHLVDYDDVLNKHRDVIYKKRREILNVGDDGLKKIILEMIENEIEQVVLFHTAADDEKTWNLQEIYEVASTIFPLKKEDQIELEDIRRTAGSKIEDIKARTKIIEYLMSLVDKAYAEMEEKFKENNLIRQIERFILLRSYDTYWMNHLNNMAHLRTGIGLVGYSQQDPLVAYKKQAYIEFQKLLEQIQQAVVYSFFKVNFVNSNSLAQKQKKTVYSGAATEMEDKPALSSVKDAEGNKVGRNDLCPCGSGKKYKKCCGA